MGTIGKAQGMADWIRLFGVNMSKQFILRQEQLGMTNEIIAKWLGVTTRQITRWRSGESKVPKTVWLCIDSKLSGKPVV